MDVPQGWVCGRRPTAPGGGGTSAGTLVPDDFSPHEEAQVQKVFYDVAVQGEVGPAAQVGDVEAEAATGHQSAVYLSHDPAEEIPVVFESQVLVIVFADVVGR